LGLQQEFAALLVEKLAAKAASVPLDNLLSNCADRRDQPQLSSWGRHLAFVQVFHRFGLNVWIASKSTGGSKTIENLALGRTASCPKQNANQTAGHCPFQNRAAQNAADVDY
jgi:hypothetical protein